MSNQTTGPFETAVLCLYCLVYQISTRRNILLITLKRKVFVPSDYKGRAFGVIIYKYQQTPQLTGI